MKMTMSYHYLGVNLNILEMLGFPKTQALETLELKEEDLSAPLERMCLDKFLSCLSAAAEFTSDPMIGLRLGHKFRVGAFGTTGSLYSYCENLEEVMLTNNLYQKLAIDAGQVEYLQKPDGSHHMCFRPHYSDVNHYRLLTDMIMASYITAYRWLSWGSGEDIMCARLSYVAENQVETYSNILQTPVQMLRCRKNSRLVILKISPKLGLHWIKS